MIEKLWGQFGDPWVLFGLFGQSFFFLRFLVQWIASERAQLSVIPRAFWYMSIGGALIVLAYGLQRSDPVLIVGQSAGLIVYLRNLWLIHRRHRDTVVRGQMSGDRDQRSDVRDQNDGRIAAAHHT
jgi:lipid-A-disaccharide synthase-like uncharacterized protein